jgi:hypothetical protein
VGTNNTAAPTTSYVLAGTAQAAPITTWTLVQTFTVPSLLLGITCPTAGTCRAVGTNSYLAPTTSYIVSSDDVGPSAHWTVQTLAPPAGPKILYGVTCRDTSTCYAVGDRLMFGSSGATPKTLAAEQAQDAVTLLVGKKADAASRALATAVTAAVTKAVLARKAGTAALFAQPARVQGGHPVVLGVSTDLAGGTARYTITYGSGATRVVRAAAGALNAQGYNTVLVTAPALKGAAKTTTAMVQVTVTPALKGGKPLAAKTTFVVVM